jgi:site-specific recombinase XerD
MAEIDRYRSDDRRQVEALYRRVFGPDAADANRLRWEWQYQRNPNARAGLAPAMRGAHLLRHSLATAMIRRGSTLSEIGQVLRHRSANTTEIYAKLDFGALRGVAMPWPTARGAR